MNSTLSRRLAAGFTLTAAILLAVLLVPGTARASDTGTLKLKVAACDGGGWLDGAQIDVVYYRPGDGQIGSDTGNTNSSGYVEFTFKGLESGDEARVTVTPKDSSPDDSHTYYWTTGEGDQNGSIWSISADKTQETPCSDTWYDEQNDIIKCFYN